jgi:hypothetical protein
LVEKGVISQRPDLRLEKRRHGSLVDGSEVQKSLKVMKVMWLQGNALVEQISLESSLDTLLCILSQDLPQWSFLFGCSI